MSNSPKKVLLLDHGQPFVIDEYLYNPIGGSEASLLMLAKGISNLNNSAVILNTSKQNSRSYNLLQNNINLTNSFLEDSDIIICNRFVDLDLINYVKSKQNKKIYYYSHDAYDQQNVIDLFKDNKYKLFDNILLVSNWQKDTFIKYFNLDKENNLTTIYNSLDSSLFYGYCERDLNKLIFASIPYKGIDFLNNIINDLVYKTKNEDLKLYVYSSMSLYGDINGNQEYNLEFQKLSHNSNIILNTNLLSMKQLAKEFQSSNIYIHPQTYHETFGMVFTQCQAAGCIPVTCNMGASKEVIYNKNNIINQPNIYLKETYDLFIDRIIYLLSLNEKEMYKQRIKCQDFVKKFDFTNIAKTVLEL